MLGKQGFGELGIIQSTVGMFGTLAGFGLGLTATKYVAELREKDRDRTSRILSLSGVVSWTTGGVAAIILAGLAPWLATQTLAVPQLAGEIRIGALLVFFGAVNGAQTGALAGLEAFKQIAHMSFWAGVANFPCMTIGCWLFGLPGAVWGLVIAQAFGCALNRWALAREARRYGVALWSARWREELGVLWTFTMPAVAGGLLTSIARWVSHAIIVRQPDGLAAMATCSVGAQFQTLILFLPALATQAAFPIMADLIGRGELRIAKRFVYRNLAINLGLTSACCLPLMLFARPLLGLYGSGYRGEELVLIIFLLSAVLASASRFLAQVLASQDSMRINLVINLCWSVLLVGCVALQPAPGAMAFAAAQFTAYLAHFGIPFAHLHRKFKHADYSQVPT